MRYIFHFEVIQPHLGAFLAAGLETIQLAVICMAIGTAIGLVIGALHTTRSRFITKLCAIYVETFRLTPFLVQLLWIYFGFPLILGISISPVVAAVAALSLNCSAYAAEIFRAGIQSVPKTQLLTGLSLGMTLPKVMWRIIVPQGIRIVMPSYVNLMVQIVKDTSMFAIIAVSEITGFTKVLASQTFRAFELYTIVAIFYFCVTFVVGKVGRFIEYRVLNVHKIAARPRD